MCIFNFISFFHFCLPLFTLIKDSPQKRKRLPFDKWANVKKPSCIPSKKEPELLMHHDHTNNKHWDHSNGTPVRKTTLKFQEISGKMASITDMDMEKIIEFSQRQMQDIERIATQLLKKLNTMKTIAETSVTSQAQSFPNASFTTEEVQSIQLHSIYKIQSVFTVFTSFSHWSMFGNYQVKGRQANCMIRYWEVKERGEDKIPCTRKWKSSGINWRKKKRDKK